MHTHSLTRNSSVSLWAYTLEDISKISKERKSEEVRRELCLCMWFWLWRKMIANGKEKGGGKFL